MIHSLISSSEPLISSRKSKGYTYSGGFVLSPKHLTFFVGAALAAISRLKPLLRRYQNKFHEFGCFEVSKSILRSFGFRAIIFTTARTPSIAGIWVLIKPHFMNRINRIGMGEGAFVFRTLNPPLRLFYFTDCTSLSLTSITLTISRLNFCRVWFSAATSCS